MSTQAMRRSQVILRMPVDHVTAALVLADGERSEVVLFVPPTEDIGRLIGSGGQRFLPMIKAGKFCLVAREAISCLGLPALPVLAREDDLPVERQLATIGFRCGLRLDGELRWTAAPSGSRTADFLNASDETFELHAADTTYHVVKAHVVQVEER